MIPLPRTQSHKVTNTSGNVEGWATQCLPTVLGRACVDDWAGAASGDSFRAVAPVAV